MQHNDTKRSRARMPSRCCRCWSSHGVEDGFMWVPRWHPWAIHMGFSEPVQSSVRVQKETLQSDQDANDLAPSASTAKSCTSCCRTQHTLFLWLKRRRHNVNAGCSAETNPKADTDRGDRAGGFLPQPSEVRAQLPQHCDITDFYHASQSVPRIVIVRAETVLMAITSILRTAEYLQAWVSDLDAINF